MKKVFKIIYTRLDEDMLPAIEFGVTIPAIDLHTALAEFEIMLKDDFKKYKILSIQEGEL